MAKRTRRKKRAVRSEPAAEARVHAKAIFSTGARASSDWLWGAALLLGVFLVYTPVWWAGFIWDDDLLLTANPSIIGPLGLKEIWTTRAADICPLTQTTLWLEHALWGLRPLPYHLVNVALHGANALLLWRVLRELSVRGAWLGAALWAVHPVQVESAAWIAEMKNTESGLFFLLSVLFFLRHLRAENSGESGGGRAYGLTLLFAAMAMASKSSTVVLPVILLLCAWGREGRWSWRSLIGVCPVLLISGVVCTLTLWEVRTGNLPIGAELSLTGPQRLITVGNAVWFYLGKVAWPHPLVLIYPRWDVQAFDALSYLPITALLISFSILWWKREEWSRSYFLALATFVAALFPMLGFVDHVFLNYSFVADHFQYLASMGPLALAGAGIARVSDRGALRGFWFSVAAGAGGLLLLGIISWQRAWVFQNEETLWTDTLAKNPACWQGYENLGAALLRKGEPEAAISLYRRALVLSPKAPEIHYDIGVALFKKGQANEAIAAYREAVALNPRYAEAHNNLGTALLSLGRMDEAIAHYQTAVALKPDYAEAHYNLGEALFQADRKAEAMAEYEKALAIDPGYAEAHCNLGNALLDQGRVEEAMAQYQRALKINLNLAEAHSNLGFVWLRKGRVDEGILELQTALKIDPDFAAAHTNLGLALFQEGRMSEAVAQFQEVVRLHPTDAAAQRNLAQAEAMARRGAIGK